MTECPLSCVRAACPDPDWLEKHSAFVLTITASASAALGIVFSYLLKSRCKNIRCCGVQCDRDVLSVQDIEVLSRAGPRQAS